MTRKSVLFGVAAVLLVGGAGTALGVLLLHEPDFYERCAVPPGRERVEKAGRFISEFGGLVTKIHDQEKRWEAQFSEECINSYFDESFVSSGVAERIMPEGVSEPRVAIEPEKIRLAFRYGVGQWSTIISIDLRVWLAAQERNVMALELQALHAGSLPFSAQSLRDRVTEIARPQNIDVTWYRHNGNPVALLRFQADRQRPTVRLDSIRLGRGWLSIRGRSTEPPMLGAMLLPITALAPGTD